MFTSKIRSLYSVVSVSLGKKKSLTEQLINPDYQNLVPKHSKLHLSKKFNLGK